MMIQIDFNSEEALYMQLRNQIILGIATAQFQEGDELPSVRALADTVGINMHTVNKAYAVLRRDGFVKVDRRRGAVIAVDIDALKARARMEKQLRVILAQALCQGIGRNELHLLIDEICDEYAAAAKE
jgi:DNA-binding transcriptional regulator YhcF (GntR family)